MNNTTNNSNFSPPQKLKVLQINLQRSHAASAQLAVTVVERKIDVILAQEPYVAHNKICGLPSTFRIVSFGVNPKAAIIIPNKDLSIFALSQVSDNHLAAIDINSQAEKLTFISAYHQPPPREGSDRQSQMIDQLERAIQSQDRNKIIIGIDANAKSQLWGHHFEDPRGENIREFIAVNGLHLLNDGIEPTFYRDGIGQSFIDLSLITPALLNRAKNWVVSTEFSASDHRYIFFDISTITPVENTMTLSKRYNTSRADWPAFIQLLTDQRDNFHHTVVSASSYGDLDSAAASLVKIITDAADKTIPFKLTGPKSKPWWTPELTQQRRSVNRLRRIFQRTRDPVLRESRRQTYSAASNIYKDAIVLSKLSAFKEFVTVSSDSDPWGPIYKMLSSKGKGKAPLKPIERPDGTLTTSEEETIRELLSAYFPQDSTCGETPEQTEMRRIMGELPDTPGDFPFTETEVLHSITSMDKKKAPGSDRITADILRETSSVLLPEITLLFNKCLHYGVFPTTFKQSMVRLIPKPNSNSANTPKAFRPICLLSVVGKALDGLMTSRLNWFLYTNHQMSQNQYGFLPQKCTVDAILDATEFARRAKESPSSAKLHALLIALDVEGAFNNAWWPYIFHQLKVKNCPRNIYALALDYFRQRTVTVETESLSITKAVEIGTPQGSRSGPIFWNILYDDFLNIKLPDGSSNQAYADDGLLKVIAPTMAQLSNTANEALEAIRTWSLRAKLTFNAVKTQALLISTNVKGPKLTLGGTRIKITPTIKYLGVTIDNKLSFTQHIEHISRNAQHSLARLSSVAKANWGIGSSAMRMIYLGAVVPAITYAAPVWYQRSRLVHNSRKLKSVQRFAALCITKAYRTAPTDAINIIANLPPIDLQIEQVAALYFAKRGQSNGTLFDSIIAFDRMEQSVYFFSLPHPALRPSFNSHALCTDRSVSIYTDGSKSPDGVGAAFVAFDSGAVIAQSQMRLNPECSVFQAELTAIESALTWLRDCPPVDVRSATLYIDSQSAIQAINKFNNTNPNVARIVTIHTGIDIQCALVWVQAHAENEGNELADSLAKAASINRELEPLGSVPLSHIKLLIRSSIHTEWQQRWTESETGRITYQYFPTISSRVALKFFTTNHTLTQFLTGHGDFRQYLHRFKKVGDPHCNCDPEAVDTPHHRIVDCPLFETHRLEFLREMQLNMDLAHVELYSLINTADKFRSFSHFIKNLRPATNAGIGVTEDLQRLNAEPS
jgi:ribonuclease HI